MRRRRFLQIAAAAVLAGPAVAAEWRGVALGADVSLSLSGPGAEAALRHLPELLQRIEATFSLYRDSELTRLNADGGGRASRWMAEALALCDRLHNLSGGAFDPTVQPLWRALADGGDVAVARQVVGWDHVHLGSGIHLGAGQALTLNGMAQGFAADLVRDWLAARGFTRALVDMGEYAALGGPFRVGLAEAGDVTLDGGALAVSLPGALRIGGQGHILHPRGALPRWTLVAVEAESAGLADGLSTGLVFATKAQARDILAREPAVRRIWLGDSQGGVVQV